MLRYMCVFRGSCVVLACLWVGPWAAGLNAYSPALGGGFGSAAALLANFSVGLPALPFLGAEGFTGGKDYLAAGSPQRVAFAAPAAAGPVPMEDVAVFDAQSSDSFSAFMARLSPPASEPESEAAEVEQVAGPSQASGPAVSAAESPEPAGAEVRLEVRPTETRQMAALFERPAVNTYSESRMFLFFPLDRSGVRAPESEEDLNVNILTPVNRLDYFTPPMRPSPQSSAVYRTQP